MSMSESGNQSDRSAASDPRHAFVAGRVALACCCAGTLALAMLAGCGSPKEADTKPPKFEVAGEAGSETAPPAAGGVAQSGGMTPAPAGNTPAQPPSIPGEQLEPSSKIVVPDGTPEELMAFIDDLKSRYDALAKAPPAPQDETRVLGQLRGICDAELQAADKILATKPAVEIRRKAVDARLHAMRFLSLVAPDKSRLDEVRRFAQQLAVDQDPNISLQGRVILLGLRLGDIRAGQDKDVAGLQKDITSLLANEAREQSVLDVTQQAEMTLRMLGFQREADDVFKAIADAFKDHADPQIAQEAANMFQELKLRDLGLDDKLDALARKTAGAKQPFITAMQQALNDGAPTPLLLDKSLRAINMLEQTGQYATGLELCTIVENAFQKIAKEPTPPATKPANPQGIGEEPRPQALTGDQLKLAARQSIDLARRRLQLVGKPLDVKGTTIAGDAFDFAKYKGKVVLVVFWATSYTPCLAELPNLRDNYEKYRAQGFEIVDVNLDQNVEAIKQFVQTEKLPWQTIQNSELAQQCGIEAIPFCVLLDQAGNVVALHARGPELGQKLTEMLGPPATPPAGTPGTGTPPAGLPTPNKQSLYLTPRSAGAGFVGSFGESELALPATDDLAEQVATAGDPSNAPAPPEDEALPDFDDLVNPYLAPADAKPMELVEFLIEMQDKPKSIQRRPGFAAAIAEAADRVLATATKPQYRTVAALAKLGMLHQSACLGDDNSESMLRAAITQLKSEKPPAVQRQIAFLQLEQDALACDALPLDKIPDLLNRLDKFFRGQDELTAAHLRLASQTVHAVNRLADLQTRESYFAKFGKLFAASQDRQLAHYGKTLAGDGTTQVDLVGKPLEMEGTTAMGAPFDWAAYRGKYVLVDFWATWCGPCRREMPRVKGLREQYSADLRVVGVNLDGDLEALAKYLQEQKVDWENLIGSSAQALATRCQIRGIPTMLLVDPEGIVIAVAHHATELDDVLAKRLAAK